MEARATFRGPSVSRALVAGVLVVVALGVGALGGYVTAKFTAAPASHAATQTIQVQSQGGPQSDLTRALPQSQGGPQSDLTRALPTAAPAVLPDWIAREIAPRSVPSPRVRQDDPNFITLPTNLSYGPWVR